VTLVRKYGNISATRSVLSIIIKNYTSNKVNRLTDSILTVKIQPVNPQNT
jgi:hypothetical protein